jgi:hypothetical protein
MGRQPVSESRFATSESGVGAPHSKTKGPSTGLNVAYQFFGMIAFRACSQEGNRLSDTLTGSVLRAMIS